MSYMIITYLLYLGMTIALTISVAHALFRNGRIFLIDIFHGNTEIADRVNKLLLTGFYLISMGYALYTLRIFGTIESVKEIIEALSVKIGIITLILGAIHFLNLFILFRLRKNAKKSILSRFPNAE